MVAVSQATLAGLLVACLVAQNRRVYALLYSVDQTTLTLHYFTPVSLLVAALGTAAALAALTRTRVRAWLTALLHESWARRIAATTAAVAMTSVWLLHAIHTDGSIAMAQEDVRFHLGFTLDETFAALDGRTPLVDFSAQYGSLWQFATALALLAFGKTFLTFTLTLCVLSGVALLAIYGVLRRVTRSSLAALALYLPFLATGLFMIGGDGVNRSSVGSYYGTFPLRYAGPLLLAWLTVRELDRPPSLRRRWLLFAVAGLAICNNGDFGFAALGATLAAFAWTARPPLRAALARIAAPAALGFATAYVLVAALTLVRTGSLPQLGRLFDYARLYAVGGYGMLPIGEVLGLHLAIYLTYVAAIVVASGRALRRATDRLLTGMLAWSGVFRLGSASYFIGRSHPVTLKWLFAAWALALALLTIAVVRPALRNARWRPSIATAIVLFGFALATCSLAQTPLPWRQVERLGAPFTATGDVPYPDPLAPSTDPGRSRAREHL